ncbi:MAG: hypothetical protein IPH80_21980 [Myxococcales bacterium]|nr:hypothetical protein [Myxococcales bacterium]
MRAAIVAALALAVAAPRPAVAERTWLGPARRVPRTWSASRDAPTLNLLVAPRDVRTAGAELAIATVRGPTRSWRFGFAGLLELESDGQTTGFGNVFPAASGAILWRGSYAYYAALALDAAAARWCAGCALELSAQYRHESQHYTGSNHGDAGMDVTAEPFVGDDVIIDVAATAVRGDWQLSGRALAFAFLPGRSSYHGGPGLDVHLRWRGWGRSQPFVSGYVEQLWGAELDGRRFADAYLARAMAGVALHSDLGDVMIYAVGDVGNRKGIRGLTEEATLGVGVRLALGAAPR